MLLFGEKFKEEAEDEEWVSFMFVFMERVREERDLLASFSNPFDMPSTPLYPILSPGDLHLSP